MSGSHIHRTHSHFALSHTLSHTHVRTKCNFRTFVRSHFAHTHTGEFCRKFFGFRTGGTVFGGKKEFPGFGVRYQSFS